MVAFFFCHPSDEEIDFEQYSSGYSSAEVSRRFLFHISGELWSITVARARELIIVVLTETGSDTFSLEGHHCCSHLLSEKKKQQQ